MTTHALVTGATGFIGWHLVKCLAARGDEVTCLVRRQSDWARLDRFDPRIHVGNLMDADSIRGALTNVDVRRDIAASVRGRLLNQAKETGRPLQELLQYFAMERFLFRLSRSEHAERFVLKGALMFRVPARNRDRGEV